MRSILFKDSASIISLISTDGWSFSAVRFSTINSSSFIEYLRDLKKFINSKWKIQNRRLILLLDNASSHSAKQTIKFIMENFHGVFFLPQYSPNMRRLRFFFSLLKHKLCTNLKGKFVGLSSDLATKGIEKWLKNIKSSEILGMWMHNFSNLKADHKIFMNRLSSLNDIYPY